ncbi:MAG: murein hydrolase activator EnvC family protein [Lentihominibacter sp.]|jgi:murein DD-endopeptidase MepM/ murein hydrolase activator NlpD
MTGKKRLTILIALVMAFTMCFDTALVSAKTLEQLQKEIYKKQQELYKNLEKEMGMADRVEKLERSIIDLEAKIEKSEDKLAVLKVELKEAQDKVDKQNDELGGRLRNMYKNGSVGFFDVLMNSGSFSEFLTNMDMVQLIYASDKKVLEELEAAHEVVEKKTREVEKETENLKHSKASSEAQKEVLEDQKAKLADDNEEMARMLDQMEAEANAMAAELAKKSDSGEISSSETSKYTGGVFCWPVPASSRITSGYGYRMCPFHGKEFHPAIDIGAPSGSAVLAASSGRVISSSYRRSFGNCIILDHGGGVTTWYCHLSSRGVGVGAYVAKGQQIAKVGSTGHSTGPHLDFRVYINGKAQNPMSYFN